MNNKCNCPQCGATTSLCPAAAELEDLKKKFAKERRRALEAWCRCSHEIEQELGKALGYPWFKDNQDAFPGATEADGVCVGDHVAASIAAEAAQKINELQALVKSLQDPAAVWANMLRGTIARPSHLANAEVTIIRLQQRIEDLEKEL